MLIVFGCPVCADILHGLPTPGAGMAGDEGLIHGLPQRHKAGPAQPGESAVQSTCIPAAAAATVGSTMKAAGKAHLLRQLPAKQSAVNDVSAMALSCNTIDCWHGQPDAGAYICSCYRCVPGSYSCLPSLYIHGQQRRVSGALECNGATTCWRGGRQAGRPSHSHHMCGAAICRLIAAAADVQAWEEPGGGVWSHL